MRNDRPRQLSYMTWPRDQQKQYTFEKFCQDKVKEHIKAVVVNCWGGEAGNFFSGGGATIFWAPISGGLKFSELAFRGGLQFSGSLWAMCGYYWVLCYWNFKYCLKYDGRASNINRIAYSKLNRTVKKHSDWLEMRSDFTWNSLQFAWLWNGFENSARELRITRLRMKAQQNRLMN